jgi:glutamate synthase (NADPH/NADH) small chain
VRTQVAIIGSGPAGLAAAQQLTRIGHTVAVYERDDQVGGLLRYGIPDFKMEKHHIDRRLEQMREEGTRFRTGVTIGVDLSWSNVSLVESYVLFPVEVSVFERQANKVSNA